MWFLAAQSHESNFPLRAIIPSTPHPGRPAQTAPQGDVWRIYAYTQCVQSPSQCRRLAIPYRRPSFDSPHDRLYEAGEQSREWRFGLVTQRGSVLGTEVSGGHKNRNPPDSFRGGTCCFLKQTALLESSCRSTNSFFAST